MTNKNQDEPQRDARKRSHEKKPLIFVGIPTHNSLVDIGTVNALMKATSLCRCAVQFNNSSLLANNFNTLYCNALNMRSSGTPFTHFCLLHSDIVPVQDDWLNILVDEMQEHHLDVLSVVVPIKDGRGLTSTGMCMSGKHGSVKHKVRRITIHESMQLPTTFTGEDVSKQLKHWDHGAVLLINTGLMMINLRCASSEQFFFTINDCISYREVKKGDAWRFIPDTESEDWCFSRRINCMGVRYGATRAVDVHHVGRFEFDSRIAWGSEHDPSHFPVEKATKQE